MQKIYIEKLRGKSEKRTSEMLFDRKQLISPPRRYWR